MPNWSLSHLSYDRYYGVLKFECGWNTIKKYVPGDIEGEILISGLNQPLDVSVDVNGDIYEEAVSFSVYFETFETPQGHRLVNEIDEVISFEVMPNYHYAYSAGLFGSLDQAESYAEEMQAKGYPFAEVNKYLNGQKVAMLDEFQLYAYAQWID